MKLRPSSACCGCVSLLAGVETVCALTILSGVSAIALCSSESTVNLSGVILGPKTQVILACWGFLGIVLSIYAGVGALYRIESTLYVYFLYQAVSFACGLTAPLAFLASGSLCEAVVDKGVQRMGSAFVCGFADTIFFMWLIIVAFIHAYFVYIIWSASEEIRRNPWPELNHYRSALLGVSTPEPPGVYPFHPTRAAPGVALPPRPHDGAYEDLKAPALSGKVFGPPPDHQHQMGASFWPASKARGSLQGSKSAPYTPGFGGGYGAASF
eukprot:TRINITY_DN63963_c0_g1_i1.p1 TRINITY_DN63963_c0_g1~~TRINITY_DN63963_c0_g1_i1.p1  ORF type:complete len:290 (-),score=39.40 TRINITY_DN63963_c0_g1_i1:51-857(-)